MLFYEETILCPEKVKGVSISRLKHLVGEFTRTRNNDQLRLVKRELQRRGINESVYIVTENEYNERVVRAVRLSEDEDEPKRNRPRRTSKQRRATNPLTNADFAAKRGDVGTVTESIDIQFDNGEVATTNQETRDKLLAVYESLTDQNKEIFYEMMVSSKDSFREAVNFVNTLEG